MDKELKEYFDAEFKKATSHLGEKIDYLGGRVGGLDEKIDYLGGRIDSLDEKIDDLDGRITKDLQTTVGFDTENSLKITASNSPITLTDDAKEFAQDAGLFDLVEKYYLDIEEPLKNKNPISNIQVEEEITNIVVSYRKFMSPEDTTKIENQSFKKGITSMGLARILTLIFRDKYLDNTHSDTAHSDNT